MTPEEATRLFIDSMWADDWDSPEDAVYDDPEFIAGEQMAAATLPAVRAGRVHVRVPVDFQATRNGNVLTRIMGSYPLVPGQLVRLVDRPKHLEATGTIVTHDLRNGLVVAEVDWDTMLDTGES